VALPIVQWISGYLRLSHARHKGHEEAIMSRALELSDEEYARLEQAAQQQGSTITELVRAWIESMSVDSSEQSIQEALAHWATIGESTVRPTQDELRAHPLLRAVGIISSGAPGWADRHDDIIAEEALDSHADE
jgi:preprotein translocase subunit Sss1